MEDENLVNSPAYTKEIAVAHENAKPNKTSDISCKNHVDSEDGVRAGLLARLSDF